MSSSWSLIHNKYSMCPYLLTHRKAIYLTWGKNYTHLSSFTCKHISLTHSLECYRTRFKRQWWPFLPCYVRIIPVGSHDEPQSVQKQEKNEHDMSSHGQGSHFKIEKFRVYLFYFKYDPRRGEFIMNDIGFLWETPWSSHSTECELSCSWLPQHLAPFFGVFQSTVFWFNCLDYLIKLWVLWVQDLP